MEAAARTLKWTLLRTALYGGSAYLAWSRRHLLTPLHDALTHKCNAFQEAGDDLRDTALRVLKSALFGFQNCEKDPQIRAQLAGNPFRRIRRSNLPLLPDRKDMAYPDSAPTLVMALDDLLAKVEYDRRYGWRVIKRPYADELVNKLVFQYELILWSKLKYPIASKLVNQWNLPSMGVLHAEDSTVVGPALVKDLNRLGRDLSRVIIVDTDSQSVAFHKENALVIEPYNGVDPEDRKLAEVLSYLAHIGTETGDLRQKMEKMGKSSQVLSERYIGDELQEAQNAWLRNISRRLLGNRGGGGGGAAGHSKPK